jgi:hypothetical protein
MGRFWALCLGLTLCSPALAGETAQYSYDALGRLVSSAYSGGPRASNQTGLCYDAAGNRTQYSYSGSAVSCAASPPPPPPPPSVSPPVANPDSASVAKCATVTKNVVANDTDPGGLTPLTLVSAQVVSGGGDVVVASSTSVQFYAPASPGSASVSYVVQNTGGATATGTLSITILNSGTACQ